MLRDNNKFRLAIQFSVLFLFCYFGFILGQYHRVNHNHNYPEKISSGELTLSQVPIQERTQRTYDLWVARNPLYNIRDIPNENISGFIWRVWVDQLIESEDGLDIQFAVLGLDRNLSPQAWERLSPYLVDELLEKHPVALAFLPVITFKSGGYVSRYEKLLETDPYWALVQSVNLPGEFLQVIPLDKWVTAVENSGYSASDLAVYLPCELSSALEEHYNVWIDRPWCGLKW